MTFKDLDEIVALLRHTPPALEALLGTLPEAWTTATEGEGTWSPCDVVGHLLHAEHTNWLPRVRHILQHGEAGPFGAFNRQGQFGENGDRKLPELLRAFRAARVTSLAELAALDLKETDLARRGLHPQLGPVSLGNVLATWAAHDLDHLHQISRTMAGTLRLAVGPWTALLGVMHCNGHGA